MLWVLYGYIFFGMVYVHYILYFCNAVWIVYELSYCSDYRPIKISLMFITLPSQQILRTLRQKCYIGLNLSIFPWRNISLNCNLYFKTNKSLHLQFTTLLWTNYRFQQTIWLLLNFSESFNHHTKISFSVLRKLRST